MRRLQLAFLSLVVLLGACAGPQARQHVLWPAVKNAWPEVRADVDGGVDALQPADGSTWPPVEVTDARAAIDDAVEHDDRYRVVGVDWFDLDSYARHGVQVRVDSGSLSAGVAGSRLERINQFAGAIQELSKR